MNKQRRKELSDIVDILSNVTNGLERVRDEEQDCFDNLPEGIADSERGQKFEEAVDYLDEAISSIEEAIAHINNAAE